MTTIAQTKRQALRKRYHPSTDSCSRSPDSVAKYYNSRHQKNVRLLGQACYDKPFKLTNRTLQLKKKTKTTWRRSTPTTSSTTADALEARKSTLPRQPRTPETTLTMTKTTMTISRRMKTTICKTRGSNRRSIGAPRLLG